MVVEVVRGGLLSRRIVEPVTSCIAGSRCFICDGGVSLMP